MFYKKKLNELEHEIYEMQKWIIELRNQNDILLCKLSARDEEENRIREQQRLNNEKMAAAYQDYMRKVAPDL